MIYEDKVFKLIIAKRVVQILAVVEKKTLKELKKFNNRSIIKEANHLA